MDEKPFLEINMLDVKSHQIDELKKFHKNYFDIDNILSSASELKYTSALKGVLTQEFSNPSPEFTKLIAKQVYDGMITPKLLEQFTSLLKKSISSLISDTISERLKSALKSETTAEEENQGEAVNMDNKDNNIVTTEEELEGFMIVRAILREVTDIDKIVYRDAQTYFAILFDDNNRKPICRLYFNGNKKYISTFDSEKKETKNLIKSLSDIYNYCDELKNTVKFYVEQD